MIKLKPFTEKDFSKLISWVSSKKIMYLFSAKTFKYPLNKKQLEEYISNDDRFIFKVIDEFSSKVIGHANLSKINQEDGNARICCVLVGNLNDRNKGYGSKIINELVTIGFNKLKLHRIELGVFDFNRQAINCYKKSGFKIESILKNNLKFDDEYWSTYTMSILNKNEKKC